MLEMKRLTKIFGGNPAVDQIDLTIRPGEFFSLLGPSGCGKTTLLRLLGGFEKPSSGEILCDGERIDLLPPHQRRFNTVFQKYALFPHLSVFENVAFGLKVTKVPSAEIKTRVYDALALVKMTGFEGRNITTLSGGQQQRIALARAIVNRPKILLLDEPLSALDLKLRQEMQVELRNLQKKLQITFIFVTHDQEEALTLSDRIAVMKDGKIEQVGTAQEIYEFPQSRFVAQFIGSTNCIDGQVRAVTEEQLQVHIGLKRDVQVRAPKDGLRPLPKVGSESKGLVLVRPEKLKILKSAPGPEHNAIEGTITEVVYRGPLTVLFVQPKEPIGVGNGSGMLVVEQVNSAVSARKSISPGEKIFAAWSPEDCLLLPHSSL